jgi:DNA-binding response OmpR family regulator
VATIAVVSDEPSLRQEILGMLASPAHRLVPLDSGRSVRPLCEREDVDLVISDLQVGSMGGIAVCLDLRLEEGAGRLGHVPFLLLLDRRADVFLARRSGADGWLVKPLDGLRLRRAVQELLAGHRFHDRRFEPVPVDNLDELCARGTEQGAASAG